MKQVKLLVVGLFLPLCFFVAGQLAAQQITPEAHSDVSSVADVYTPTEQRLQRLGLVDVTTLDPTIAVYMVYATPHNFMGRRLYEDLHHAFLVPEAAAQLVDASRRLKALRPDLSLIVYDAARPISIQRQMWEVARGTPMSNFVADPTKGRGMHNYGAAVDVTLMDCTGHPLPMGSEYDYFGDAARVNIEAQLLASGQITPRELSNRQLLRRVMTEAGFLTITSEWWHFNLTTVAEAQAAYKIIE